MPPRVFQGRRLRCGSLVIPMHRGSIFATGPSLAFLWNRWSSSHKENILLMSAASDSRETEIGERLTPSLTTTKIECDYGGRGTIIASPKPKNGRHHPPPPQMTARAAALAERCFFVEQTSSRRLLSPSPSPPRPPP